MPSTVCVCDMLLKTHATHKNTALEEQKRYVLSLFWIHPAKNKLKAVESSEWWCLQPTWWACAKKIMSNQVSPFEPHILQGLKNLKIWLTESWTDLVPVKEQYNSVSCDVRHHPSLMSNFQQGPQDLFGFAQLCPTISFVQISSLSLEIRLFPASHC